MLYGAASVICPKSTGHTLQNLVLCMMSCLFYAWGEPYYIFLMLVQILIVYGLSLIMERKQEKRAGTIAYLLAILFPLSSLFYFKYSGIKNLTLPIGISFYTFQLVSYAIDVRRRVVKPPKSLLTFMTYVTFFPQLIAGPIVRYSDMERELTERTRTNQDMADGIVRFSVGLAKKVLLANVLGEFVQEASQIGQRSLALSWGYALAVSLQLYFDFSGYSDMAIGLGHMFGFHFPENFQYPFISKSMAEFWRRWHMTLGAWFRDYVYIPLGGNRVRPARWVLNILIVWTLTGLWHGAGWNFAVWGFYFGILLIVERAIKINGSSIFCKVLQHAYVVVGILISFLIFHEENMDHAWLAITSLWKIPASVDEACGYLLRNRLGILALGIIGATPLPRILWGKLCTWMNREWMIRSIQGVAVLVLMVLCTAYLIDGSFNPFLYFRF